MPKVSPARRSFNAGEFSPLVEGRTDLDRYPASMRKMVNFVAAPQGPAIRRSGTGFVCEAYSHEKYSGLIPFVFSDEEALMIEACDERMRFVLDGGLQVYTERAITNITQASPMKIVCADLDANADDEVVLSGFPEAMNVNGETVKITNVDGDTYTLDYSYAGSLGAPATAAKASLVYSITAPYLHDDVRSIRWVQSVDVLYLFCNGYKPRKLSRYNSYDWRISSLTFDNGPFMPEGKQMGGLTPGSTGNPATGGTPSSSGAAAGHDADAAFDDNKDTYFETASDQAGWLQYQFAQPVAVNGYVIYPARVNSDASYASNDYAPGDWEFMGSNDGATWYLLDKQVGYVLYDDGRSTFFKIKNEVAYSYYRLHVYACTRNGPIHVRIQKFVMSTANRDIVLSLGGTYSDVNKGEGFLSTDVDRLIRVKGSDQNWRVFRIKIVSSSTTVTATLLDDPLPDTSGILNWQMGYWSDTTGWPQCGTFYEDRLWAAGSVNAPDLIAGSRTGAYEDMLQRTSADEVLDDNAIVVRLNSRRLSAIRWISNDERSLLVGTGTHEAVISAANTEQAMTARNIKSRSSTERGSARIEPVKVDRQILYTQSSRRTVREYAYVFESDGYKSPSMSLMAGHLGVPRLAQMAYAAEPHSIIWYRRDDGSVVGMTYNREENVIGWHRHDFAGGLVESIGVIPSSFDKQDTLWLVVQREIGGADKRYIERLVRFWDFDSTIDQAHFVDSGLRYEGDPVSELFGLRHLEGCEVCGLADGIPFEGLTVEDGRVALPHEASNVVIGLNFVSEAEISRIEAGAADGTAQGKEKRIHNCVVHVWASAFGEIGRPDEQRPGEIEWADIPYAEPYDELQPIALQSGMFGPIVMPRGYGKDGTLTFRQTKPCPFNIVQLLPQLDTIDR